MSRPLHLVIAAESGGLTGIIGAWAQQADHASLPVIVGTGGGAFATTFALVITALVYATQRDATA